MASNTLATVLNDAAGRALVERFLDKRFLERRDWEGVLANSKYLSDRGIPNEEGQYIKFTRIGRFRRPSNVDLTAETSDPLSGATMATEQLNVPIEFIHEFISIGTIAMMTSWIDLEAWADEDLPMALKRRMHELTQNAFIVGRFQPGQYDASGNASTAFDTTVEKTVSLYGLSFTFQEAPKLYANSRANFNALAPSDRITWTDLQKAHTRLSLAGAPKVNGYYMAFISESVKNDLIAQDPFFQLAIRNWDAGKNALVDNQITTYAGWHFVIDDQPFTENFNAEAVRAAWGPVHSCILMGKNAGAFINLGNKRANFRPKFKVQDISKTGKEKTIGYTIPFQAAVLNPNWCIVLKGPVSEFTPNNYNSASVQN